MLLANNTWLVLTPAIFGCLQAVGPLFLKLPQPPLPLVLCIRQSHISLTLTACSTARHSCSNQACACLDVEEADRRGDTMLGVPRCVRGPPRPLSVCLLLTCQALLAGGLHLSHLPAPRLSCILQLPLYGQVGLAELTLSS